MSGHWKNRVRIERVGRRRLSAARGMARLGFRASVIAHMLRIRRSTAERIVAEKPASIWSPAHIAAFREAGR